ncbi:MAG TPA: bifunctional DNA primase/polymerase, partial [Polyangiaceae bacterium]
MKKLAPKPLAASPKAATRTAAPDAHTLAEMGLSPIRIAKRDKPPIDTGWQSAPIDAEAVDAWLAQGGNVGLRMGEQPGGTRLVALDEDEPGSLVRAEATLGALPLTLTARTGSGGQHRIFEWPDGRELPKGRVRALEGIDVRSQGGQIVVAPSVHPNGKPYEWTAIELPATLPDAWCDALLAGRPARAKALPRASVSATAPARVDDPIVRAVYPHYAPKHSGRHGIVRPLAAYLARRGKDDDYIASVFMALPSDTKPARVAQALEAAQQARRGEETPGWKALCERLGEDTAREIERAAKDPREPEGFPGIWSQWWARAYTLPNGWAVRKASNDAAPTPTPAPSEPPPSTGGRDPEVDHVIEHLATPAVNVYQRGGQLVTITRDAHVDGGIVRPVGAPTIRALVPARLKEIIRMTAGQRQAQLASEVVARGEWAGIRPLDAIVSYPVMRRDGTLLMSSGYDAATRTLAEIAISVDVPDAPTQADARAGLAMLADLVCDFPFADAAHRSAWLALVLTIVARPAIDGPTPMLLLDANQRGAGKTMLADVAALITTGASAPRRTAPETAEEWRKVIFAMLLAGDPICLIDNVTRMLVSAALDAMLTGTTYQDRVLGVSEQRTVAVRTVMIASANNCRISTDLVRRSLHCRLESDSETPADRRNADDSPYEYRYPDLLTHVREHRAELLAAALTVLRAYAVAGQTPVQARAMGSYPAWCRVVRDALVWAGGADPVTTQDELRESSDVERDELRDLLTAWHAVLGEQAVTTRELLAVARGGPVPGVERARRHGRYSAGPSEAESERAGALLDALRGITPGGAEPAAHAIGNRLRTIRGQLVGDLVLR